MELDLKCSYSTVARKHLIKRTEEAIESFLRDDCATNLKLIGALEEISFRLFAESNDVFLSEAFNAPDDNEFHWDDEFMFTSFPCRIEDDSGLPDENEWLIESIRESKPSICSTENSDADYFVRRSPLMMHLTVSPGALVMTSSTAKFNCHENAEIEFMLESDEIWMLDTCDQENDEKWFLFATPSTAKSTRDSKLHEYSWMITGFKSGKCRMPVTFGPEHLRKRPFRGINSASKTKKRGLMSTGRGKHQEDRRVMTRQEASKDGRAEKSEENSKKKKRKSVVRRLFTNERGVGCHSGSNNIEDFMLEGDISIAETAHVGQYVRSYQNKEEESYRGPFHHVETINGTLSRPTRQRSANEDMMEVMNGDKSLTRVRLCVMDTQETVRHTETKEGPGDDQNWLVISTEKAEGSICSRNMELSDDCWILISHNERNSATHKDSLYYYHDKISLCHQEVLSDSPISTFDRNVGVTNSLYNPTGIRLAEPFTGSRASSTKMQTKVISQATEMESGPQSPPPSFSFHYESEYDDWIIITVQEVEKLERKDT